jgi:hypothetical protein
VREREREKRELEGEVERDNIFYWEEGTEIFPD